MTAEDKVQNIDLKQFAERIYKFQNLNNNILQLYRRFAKPDEREKVTELAPPTHPGYQKNVFQQWRHSNLEQAWRWAILIWTLQILLIPFVNKKKSV